MRSTRCLIDETSTPLPLTLACSASSPRTARPRAAVSLVTERTWPWTRVTHHTHPTQCRASRVHSSWFTGVAAWVGGGAVVLELQ
jgi:hypothetical protein